MPRTLSSCRNWKWDRLIKQPVQQVMLCQQAHIEGSDWKWTGVMEFTLQCISCSNKDSISTGGVPLGWHSRICWSCWGELQTALDECGKVTCLDHPGTIHQLLDTLSLLGMNSHTSYIPVYTLWPCAKDVVDEEMVFTALSYPHLPHTEPGGSWENTLQQRVTHGRSAQSQAWPSKPAQPDYNHPGTQ